MNAEKIKAAHYAQYVASKFAGEVKVVEVYAISLALMEGDDAEVGRLLRALIERRELPRFPELPEIKRPVVWMP